MIYGRGSWLALSSSLPDQSPTDAICFLRRAWRFDRQLFAPAPSDTLPSTTSSKRRRMAQLSPAATDDLMIARRCLSAYRSTRERP